MSLFFYVGLFTSFAQTHSPSNSMNLILSSPNGPQKFIGPTLYQVSIGGYWILGRWGWQNGKIPGVPQWGHPELDTHKAHSRWNASRPSSCAKSQRLGAVWFGPQNALWNLRFCLRIIIRWDDFPIYKYKVQPLVTTHQACAAARASLKAFGPHNLDS